MVAEVQIKIEGLAELRKTLRALPDNLRRVALNNMLRKGGRIIVAAQKAEAPHDTYALRDAITMKTTPKSKTIYDAQVRIGVLSDVGPGGLTKGTARKAVASRQVKSTGLTGFANSDVYYWRFQEFGTVRNPGGHPFLVPGFESVKFYANKVMLDDLAKQVQKAAAKARAQQLKAGGSK